MRPFVHQSLAWTVLFAVSFTLMTATAFAQGNLDTRWRSVFGAAEGLLMLGAFSIACGVSMAAVVRLFDWIGWDRYEQQKPIPNPIVRAAIAPLLLYGLIILLSLVLPRSWR